MFHFRKFENHLEFFWTEELLSALLTVLPDWHDTIACISSASQFNILEANKVKGLVVLNKTYQPFSFMLPPNSTSLLAPLSYHL